MSEGGQHLNAHNGVKKASPESIFKRHPAKVLNFSLLAYLAFGAVTFDYLSQEEATTSSPQVATQGDKKAEGFVELRLDSARRLWNITNRLNILYEANWTALVLDELIEFERKLIDQLESDGGDGESVEAEEEEEREEKNKRKNSEDGGSEESDSGGDNRDKKPSKPRQNMSPSSGKKGRFGSIRKSFIHSLATITTIASPDDSPKSGTAKVFTILYGAIGIPLTFCTVSLTGFRLTVPAVNLLRILRHYFISLPVHYLCCTCDLYFCFRLLSWCCCCCCCSYFCCPFKPKAEKRARKERSPKLKLLKGHPRRLEQATSGGAPGSVRSRAQQQPTATPFAITTSQNNCDPSGEERQQKTVRFGGDQETSQSTRSPYTFRLFLASLVLLTAYLISGAFVYARIKQTTPIEALYSCYSMLSASKLPDSFSLKKDLRERYSHGPAEGAQRASRAPANTDLFIIDCLYLFCGLNLISMCSHFARLWLGGDLARQLSKCIDEFPVPLPSLDESLVPLNAIQSLASAEVGLPAPDMSRFQAPAELYVVDQADSRAPILHHQASLNPGSELSFSSDRSAIDNMDGSQPLCIHHRAAHKAQNRTGDSPALYASDLTRSQPAPHKYLYLARADERAAAEISAGDEHLLRTCMSGGTDRMRPSSSSLQITEGKSIRFEPAGGKPSQSQTLNRPRVNYLSSDRDQHQTGQHSPMLMDGGFNYGVLIEPNRYNGEQLDSSLTTDSNTISSLRQLQPNGALNPNGIGFIFNHQSLERKSDK